MSTIISFLISLFKSLPIIERLLNSMRKTEQEKVDDVVDKIRKEIDEFKRTGRPPK